MKYFLKSKWWKKDKIIFYLEMKETFTKNTHLKKSVRELQRKDSNEQFTGFLLLYSKSQSASKWRYVLLVHGDAGLKMG